MCRFIAYLGKPILLEDVLYKPKNSLIKQSIRARETEEPLNGDGFGVGWYNHDIDYEPGLFTSTQPAWNDKNLRYLSAKIRSNCFFAHVRAASHGGVAQYNCHPFHYKHFLFMHNGEIGGFTKIKRYLRNLLNDEIYNWINGQTDSEHFFALFLNQLQAQQHTITAEVIAATLRETIHKVEELKKAYHVHETTYINAVITDGICMVAVRYVSNSKQPASSLHYAKGTRYECDNNGVCHIHKSDGEDAAILISSEKLSNYSAEWQDVPINHFLIVDKYLKTTSERI